jgi:hypothetical protein
LYGEKYELSFPTSRQLDDYLKKLNKINAGELDKSDFELTIDLMNELGLPQDVCMNIEIAHLNELSMILLDQKKI